ncbi:hypothetical protein [Aureispira anguillae]|uniref:Outer membrane protein beta-barrel domain-containing protein n=1 Tax=Aureispira anguillae TaxID=2864201 RepID=A0A916DQM7_9BACT|nr:hypothetical protein [Aureispira anguillae]BDS10806.1 hypothetical protein AsAng_0015150 [Aureispira anguillae]
MKYLIFGGILCVFLNTNLWGQHSISINGGWTYSNLYQLATKEAFEASYYHKELFDFGVVHMPFLGMKYEYIYHSLRLSTGINVLSMGANHYYLEGAENIYMYLTFPIIVGYQFNFKNNYSLVLEGGVEGGTSIANVGSVVALARYKQTRPYIGLLLGLEGKYKRFSLGAKFHLGLNVFDKFVFGATYDDDTLYFKHIGGTVYLGYTLWNSSQSKKEQ